MIYIGYYNTLIIVLQMVQDLVEIDLQVGAEANFSKESNTRDHCNELLADSTVTLEHVQSSTSVILQLNQ